MPTPRALLNNRDCNQDHFRREDKCYWKEGKGDKSFFVILFETVEKDAFRPSSRLPFTFHAVAAGAHLGLLDESGGRLFPPEEGRLCTSFTMFTRHMFFFSKAGLTREVAFSIFFPLLQTSV